MKAQYLVLLLCGVVSTGCATTLGGRNQAIHVESDPAGATLAVDCGIRNADAGKTPVTIHVSRQAEPCRITLSKEGYQRREIDLVRQFNPAFLGNLTPVGVVIEGAIESESGSGFGSELEEMTEIFFAGVALGITGIGMAIDGLTGAVWTRGSGTIVVTLERASREEISPRKGEWREPLTE